MKNRAGFTLVELLVVISIIAILSAIVSVNYSTIRAKNRDDQRHIDLANVAIALELFRAQNKKYPVQVGFADINVLSTSLVPNFVSSLPIDPKFARPYSFAGGGYIYASNPATVGGQARTPGSLFILDTLLESTDTEDVNSVLMQPANQADSGRIEFYNTGEYRSGSATGPIHFRIASK